MNSSLPNSELKLDDYQIGPITISLIRHPEVWPPYSAHEMLLHLYQSGHLVDLKGKKVLDMGTGSGIVGILCGLLGASEVYLSDYSKAAVDLALQNAHLNQVFAQGVTSDCFRNLEGEAFDLIISNPPVQPWLFTDLDHPEERSKTSAWNESGKNGRLVLDALIKESAQFLKPGGTLITSSSSRHGHNQTIDLFNEYWRSNWEHIFQVEHALDPDYHAPYLPIWTSLQKEDFDLRIFRKDVQGNACFFFEQLDKKFCISYPGNNPLNLSCTWVREKEVWQVWDEAKKSPAEPAPDFLAQVRPNMSDKNWYYQYYLIKARK